MKWGVKWHFWGATELTTVCLQCLCPVSLCFHHSTLTYGQNSPSEEEVCSCLSHNASPWKTHCACIEQSCLCGQGTCISLRNTYQVFFILAASIPSGSRQCCTLKLSLRIQGRCYKLNGFLCTSRTMSQRGAKGQRSLTEDRGGNLTEKLFSKWSPWFHPATLWWQSATFNITSKKTIWENSFSFGPAEPQDL